MGGIVQTTSCTRAVNYGHLACKEEIERGWIDEYSKG